MTARDRKALLADYEVVKDAVDLSPRQRELFEAWVYSNRSLGQLAQRYNLNSSSVSRTIQRAARKVAKLAQLLYAVKKADRSRGDILAPDQSEGDSKQ